MLIFFQKFFNKFLLQKQNIKYIKIYIENKLYEILFYMKFNNKKS